MDDFGNGFDSRALFNRIEDINGDISAGIGRYWWFVLSGYEEWTHQQRFYMDIFEREGFMPCY